MGDEYTFFTDTTNQFVEYKSDGPHYYVTGYISTGDKDLVNDVVTEDCMLDMLRQLNTKNVKLDIEHEVFVNNPTAIPIGRIVEARKDENGIWVKAELNKAHSRFNEVWSSIKSKMLDAFSIAYKPIKTAKKAIQGVAVRLLEQVNLLNVALTGNPVNPHARISDVMMKSIADMNSPEESDEDEEDTKKKKKDKEENNMSDETKTEVQAEVKSEATAVVAEAPVEQKSQVPDFESAITELKGSLAEMKSQNEADKKTIEELQAEVKSLKQKLDEPQLKALQEPKEELVQKVVGPLDLVR